MFLKRKKILTVLAVLVFSLVFQCAEVTAGEMTPIEMSFKSADLRDVFRILSEMAGVNLITDNSVTGDVTVHFKDVTFIEAIGLITKANELGYKKIANTYFIATPERLKELFAQAKTEIFYLEYADPSSLSELLANVDDDISVEYDKRLGALVVNCDADKMDLVSTVVRELDAPKALIAVDVRVEEISTSGLSELGVSDDSLKMTGIRFLPMDEGGLELGLEFPNFLQTLEDDGLAYNLANPRLTTVDGEKGRLLIGDRIPVRVEEVEDGQRVTTIKYIDVGIFIEYTARVSRDGFITMAVRPQVSTLGEEVTQGFPHIRTREADTEIRIKSGETFAIGGLRQSKEMESMSKVPFLGELPIIGQLFQRARKDQAETELVIFIRATAFYPEGGNGEGPEEGEKFVHVTPENSLEPSDTEEQEVSKDPVAEIEESPADEITTTPPVTEPEEETEDRQKPAEEKEPVTEAFKYSDDLDIPPHIARWLELFSQGKSLSEDDTDYPDQSTGEGQREGKTVVPEKESYNSDFYSLPGEEKIPIDFHFTYQLKSGENLWRVGQKFGIPYQLIQEINHIDDIHSLPVGKVLVIPVPETHIYTIKYGDTIESIAKKFDISVDNLKELNGLEDGIPLAPGERIILSKPVN